MSEIEMLRQLRKTQAAAKLNAGSWKPLFDQLATNNDCSSVDRLETPVVVLAIQQVVLR